MRQEGSIQLRRFRQAREQGHGLVNAAAYAGIGEGEAKLIDQEDERARQRWLKPRDHHAPR